MSPHRCISWFPLPEGRWTKSKTSHKAKWEGLGVSGVVVVAASVAAVGETLVVEGIFLGLLLSTLVTPIMENKATRPTFDSCFIDEESLFEDDIPGTVDEG